MPVPADARSRAAAVLHPPQLPSGVVVVASFPYYPVPRLRILLRVADLELAVQQRRLGTLSIFEPSTMRPTRGPPMRSSPSSWPHAGMRLTRVHQGAALRPHGHARRGRLHLPARRGRLLQPRCHGLLQTPSSNPARASSWYSPSSSLFMHFFHFADLGCRRGGRNLFRGPDFDESSLLRSWLSELDVEWVWVLHVMEAHG
jgi:hypothetical protein